LLWRLPFHQPWWLVAWWRWLSIVVASTISTTSGVRGRGEPLVAAVPPRAANVLATQTINRLLLLGPNDAVSDAACKALLALTIHRVRGLLRRRLTR
jgi:hypothetical protein